MKHCYQWILLLALLMHGAAALASCPANNTAITCFSPRSPGRTKLLQTVAHQYCYNTTTDQWYNAYTITPEYAQSFRRNDITRCFFGPCLEKTADCSKQQLVIQGNSDTINRKSNALLANYFYLPRDFESTISFNPSIRNVSVHFDWYSDLSCFWEGSYLRLYGPLTHSHWDMELHETVVSPGTANYSEGAFTPGELPRSALLNTATEYFNGLAPVLVDSVTFQPLTAGKINNCSDSTVQFADLRVEFGKSICCANNYNLTLNIQAAAPTSSSKKGCYLFAPHAGDNRWELGGGLIATYRAWENSEDDCSLLLTVDANVTHQFNKKERRVFDLKDKPLSRYMLAQKLEANSNMLNGSDGGNPVASQLQFAHEYAPVANLTVQDVYVRSNAHADIVLQGTFEHRCFSWSVGYNFWARSCEKVNRITDSCCPNPLTGQNKWALKGNAQTFGFIDETDTAIPLAATQSKATIKNGVDPNRDLTGTPGILNTGIDSPQQAFQDSNPLAILPNTPATIGIINTSIQPRLITIDDINFEPASRGISHTLFSALQYRWESDCWQPYISIGARAEFGKKVDDLSDCEKSFVLLSCNQCVDCALSQWSIWFQIGFSYDG